MIYGFQLAPNMSLISALAFADDIAVVTKSVNHASYFTILVITLLSRTDLNTNPKKNQTINVFAGIMHHYLK